MTPTSVGERLGHERVEVRGRDDDLRCARLQPAPRVGKDRVHEHGVVDRRDHLGEAEDVGVVGRRERPDEPCRPRPRRAADRTGSRGGGQKIRGRSRDEPTQPDDQREGDEAVVDGVAEGDRDRGCRSPGPQPTTQRMARAFHARVMAGTPRAPRPRAPLLRDEPEAPLRPRAARIGGVAARGEDDRRSALHPLSTPRPPRSRRCPGAARRAAQLRLQPRGLGEGRCAVDGLADDSNPSAWRTVRAGP